jgi:GDPmannose 4,6-dehydratase
MWLMLQTDEPADYVVGTGVARSVREFTDAAFAHAGLDPEGHVVVDEALFRPAEVDHLVADPSKARAELGWEPKTTFVELARLMVDADLERLRTARSPAATPEAADSVDRTAFGDAVETQPAS